MNVKLACVIRTDLGMSPGLLAAQACHINDEWIRRRVLQKLPFSEPELQWLSGPVISVLAVNIPEELDQLILKAKENRVNYHIWKDTIPSKIFAGQFLELVVGVSFGPDDDEKVKQITGTLPLY